MNKYEESINYFQEENKLTKELFDLDEILEFQLTHDVQIIRGDDFQYYGYINKVCYDTSLTSLSALVLSIKKFKERNGK